VLGVWQASSQSDLSVPKSADCSCRCLAQCGGGQSSERYSFKHDAASELFSILKRLLNFEMSINSIYDTLYHHCEFLVAEACRQQNTENPILTCIRIACQKDCSFLLCLFIACSSVAANSSFFYFFGRESCSLHIPRYSQRKKPQASNGGHSQPELQFTLTTWK